MKFKSSSDQRAQQTQQLSFSLKTGVISLRTPPITCFFARKTPKN